MTQFRDYVPALLLLVGCVLVLDARTQQTVALAAPLTAAVPTFPGYEVKEQTISADERRVAGMSDYVARAYIADSAIAFTTLVSYYERQTQGRTIHSPRNCLPGAGWEIMSGGSSRIAVDGDDSKVNRYILKNGSATALVYYWYQGRGRVTASEYAVKWNLLRDAALSGRTEEALVRIVIPVLGQSGSPGMAAEGMRIADSTAQQVAGRLVASVNRVLPPAD